MLEASTTVAELRKLENNIALATIIVHCFLLKFKLTNFNLLKIILPSFCTSDKFITDNKNVVRS